MTVVDQGRREREQSFVEFYERHYGAVLAYARRRSDEATARDVTAETFLVAWRRLEELDRLDLPWLYRTAGFQLQNAQRAARRQRRTTGRLASQPAGEVPDPAVAHADRAAVRQALRTLSDSDRELLLLMAWEQLDTRELAAVLGCSVPTTAVRLHRARRRLQQALTVAVDELDQSRGPALMPHRRATS